MESVTIPKSILFKKSIVSSFDVNGIVIIPDYARIVHEKEPLAAVRHFRRADTLKGRDKGINEGK
jgi:hypothetical protein